jgi:protein-disulfide isomerase
VRPVAIHVLMSPGCGHGQKTLELVRAVAAELAPSARIETSEIRSMEEADLFGFRGSPTVLVNGVDVDPGPPGGVGLG